jgi:hypothetical protein
MMERRVVLLQNHFLSPGLNLPGERRCILIMNYKGMDPLIRGQVLINDDARRLPHKFPEPFPPDAQKEHKGYRV